MKNIRYDYCPRRQENPFTNNYKKAKKREKFAVQLKVIGFSAIILIASLCWLLFFSKVFKVENISINGNQRLLSADIESEVRSSLGGLANNNLLLANQGKIIANIKKKFNLKAVTVDKEWPHGLTINISERGYAWLYKEADIYRWIDEDGYVIETIDATPVAAVMPSASSTASTTEISVETAPATAKPENIRDGKIFPLVENNGESYFKESENRIIFKNPDLSKDINYLDSELKKAEYQPLIVEKYLLNSKNKEFNTINIKFSGQLYILFNDKGDFDSQLANLRDLKGHFKDLNTWKRIDLRYGDKVYYEK